MFGKKKKEKTPETVRNGVLESLAQLSVEELQAEIVSRELRDLQMGYQAREAQLKGTLATLQQRIMATRQAQNANA